MTPQDLVQVIQEAIAPDATAEVKARGAAAARTLQTLLGATPGAPLVQPAVAPTPLGQVVEQMRNTPQTVMLDALITKLREYVPEDGDRKSVRFNVPFVRVEGMGKSDG